MTANNLIREHKGLWLTVVCAVAAFGLLNTVLGSPMRVRTGTVTITQVFEDDLGSMVVEATRPSNARVAGNNGQSTKHAKTGEKALQLAVGF
jgi:hypothetical protein